MKIKKIISTVILVILIAVAVISGFKLITTYSKLSSENSQMENLAEEVRNDENLFEKNKDMICWIKIDGTGIDYPVMYTPEDPEYYLHRDFDKEYSYSGVPFLDYRCDIDKSDNLIIYGHNMKNSTMFSTLLNYEEYDFWKEHKYIDIETKDGERRYKIIAAYKTEVQAKDSNAFRYYGFTDAQNESEYEQYIYNIKKLALYDTGITAEYGTQLMTLSTCSYHTEDGRFAVTAKLVE